MSSEILNLSFDPELLKLYGPDDLRHGILEQIKTSFFQETARVGTVDGIVPAPQDIIDAEVERHANLVKRLNDAVAANPDKYIRVSISVGDVMAPIEFTN